ncbi:MAG: DUF2764 domain-containing protein [Treponema sp.]|jgi:hypothetical protein|nr:DUF2764 domain-containing protein [Treponema sp.]
MAYYFLVAQLPSLAYGEAPPMSSVHFRELCAGGLSAADAARLPHVALDPRISDKTGTETAAGTKAAGAGAFPFIARWNEWERALRLNLAKYRAVKMRREAPPDVPDFPAGAAAAAKAAAAMASPLEAEIFLDGARWKAIEELQGLSYFSVNTVYAYLLKLLLVERRSRFRAEEGFSEYKALYASIMGEAKWQEPGVLW